MLHNSAGLVPFPRDRGRMGPDLREANISCSSAFARRILNLGIRRGPCGTAAAQPPHVVMKRLSRDRWWFRVKAAELQDEV